MCVHSLWILVHVVHLLWSLGLMLILAIVRHLLTMAVMETQTDLPTWRIVKTDAWVSVFSQPERYIEELSLGIVACLSQVRWNYGQMSDGLRKQRK